MSPSEAERILGVKSASTPDEIRAAFAQAVKFNHPDAWPLHSHIAALRVHHGDPPMPKLWPMQALKDARDTLLSLAGHHATTPAPPCPICRGTGIQMVRMARVPCVRGCDPD